MISFDELRSALNRDELVPYFQPIVELRTGRLAGFEVLTRWAHPSFGTYLPINLIELAEQSGLIDAVALQVFTKAFAALRHLPEPLRLSVNVSPVQLGHEDFVGQMQEMSLRTGFPLSHLTIEITESALLSDLARSLEVAHGLKALGCRLSLDDFGTGFSSLAHLQALPFDELKIDRSFVSRMTDRRDSRKIVAAMIGLGRSLGLKTVAEGIEEEGQADMLLRLGGELGQGWHFGRPMPLEAMCEMLTKRSHCVETSPEVWMRKEETVSSLEAFPAQRLAQLRAIYDGAPVGLCFVDCHLRYVSVNRRLAEMNGASVAAHLGARVIEIVPEFYPNVEPYLMRALAGEAIAGVEVPRPRRNSDEMGWMLVSYQPAFDEADEVIGISISVMDITELKQARDGLKEMAMLQSPAIAAGDEASHRSTPLAQAGVSRNVARV